MAEHNKIGKLGEYLAEKFLLKNDFLIIEKNFFAKTGEIDIIANKRNEENIYFIEVKSKKTSHFDFINKDLYSPENNLSKKKIQKMLKTIKIYLNYKNLKEYETNIVTMALIVYIDIKNKKAKIKTYELEDLIRYGK